MLRCAYKSAYHNTAACLSPVVTLVARTGSALSAQRLHPRTSLFGVLAAGHGGHAPYLPARAAACHEARQHDALGKHAGREDRRGQYQSAPLAEPVDPVAAAAVPERSRTPLGCHHGGRYCLLCAPGYGWERQASLCTQTDDAGDLVQAPMEGVDHQWLRVVRASLGHLQGIALDT